MDLNILGLTISYLKKESIGSIQLDEKIINST